MTDLQPVRGQIYWVAIGREGEPTAAEHPALIVQSDEGNQTRRVVIVAEVSTDRGGQLAGLPYTVPVKIHESGLPHDSVVNTGQLHTVLKTRLLRPGGRLAAGALARVDRALRYSLGFEAWPPPPRTNFVQPPG